MPTFTEILPASKTSPNRAMRYTPCCAGCGVVELTDKRSHVRYALAVQPFGGVRFTKAGGAETYVATASACDCAGFTYGQGTPCKHVAAVRALVANDWLSHDGRETVTDRHAEAEGRDAHYSRGL